jgi:hypothetical protein
VSSPAEVRDGLAASVGESSELDHGPLVTPPTARSSAKVKWPTGIADRISVRFGADASGNLRCPLPGHKGSAYVDSIPDQPSTELRLLCCSGRWRSLGEVRAVLSYGEDHLLSNIQNATWLRRLAYEVDAFTPADVRLRPLAPDAPEYLRRAHAGFELLIGLRWADGPRRPVAWSVRFVSAWCGLTFREAHAAIAELRQAGLIVEAGRVGRMSVYLPGTPQLHAVEGLGT